MEVRHLLIEPRYEVRHFSVDTRIFRCCTSNSPAYHSNEGQGITLVRVSSYKGTSTVSCAGVLAALHDPRTHHVLRHVQS